MAQTQQFAFVAVAFMTIALSKYISIYTLTFTSILRQQNFLEYNVLCFRLSNLITPDDLNIGHRSHPRNPNIELFISEHRPPQIQSNMLH